MSTKKMIALVVVCIAGLASVSVPATAQVPKPLPAPIEGDDYGGYVEQTSSGPIYHRANAEDVRKRKQRIAELDEYIDSATEVKNSLPLQLTRLSNIEAHPDHSPGKRRAAFLLMQQVRAEQLRIGDRITLAKAGIGWLEGNDRSPNRPVPTGDAGSAIRNEAGWTAALAGDTIKYAERQYFIEEPGTDCTEYCKQVNREGPAA